MTDRGRFIVADPPAGDLGSLLRAALPIPQDDREAKTERRLLHRADLKQAVMR
jgi:hypothetical protein